MNASQRSNSNDGGGIGDFRAEPLYRRFELRGQPLSAALGLLRAFDQRTDQEVAIRRVSSRIDPSVLRSLLAFDPNVVVPVAEILRDDDGPYLVSPLPHGTLADRLEHGPLDSDEIARVTFDLALGLNTMHAAGCAPMDPRPDTIATSLDGRMRLMAIAAPLDAVENTAIAAPFAHDLRTLGRTLVALARGQQSETAIDVDAAPMSLRPLLRGCLSAGTPQGFADAAGLLTALGHDAGPQAGSDTLLDTGEVLDIAESTAGGTAQVYADTTTAKRTRGGTTGGSGSGSRSKSAAMPFPFRKLSELYEIVGGPKTGGMGAVHMAVERATQRKVAVKRLKTRDVDSSILERFYREAHAIASLNHPYILQLLQPGRDDEGDYLILEWASGGSLKDALGKSPALPEAQVLDIARKIGSALAYAHSKGVIHRDIKPHNILLTETGEPKLADFGLARQVDDLTLSTSKHGAGSPLYMAPEQHNSTRDADARSDLYSFGKTLYQLATGKLPNSPDPRLLPASLRGPIMRCMEEEPERRPGSVNEFLRDLERASRPVSARVAILALAALVVTIGVYALRDKWQPKRPVTDPPNVAGDTNVRDPEPRSVQTRSQPILGSLLALVGSQEQNVANGATAATQVSMRIQFEGEDPKIDPKQVVVLRNDQPLSDADAQVIQDKDGLKIVAALTSGANEFRVKVADFGTVSAPRIERTFPLPRVDAVDGAIANGTTWVTASDSISLSGTVARAQGVKTLLLEDSTGTKVNVKVTDDRFQTKLPIPANTPEGVISYDWRMPPEYGDSRLEGGPIRVVIDRTAPAVELIEPKSGSLLTTEVSDLRVRGRIRELNRLPAAKVEIELAANGAALPDSKRNLEVLATNDSAVGEFEFAVPLPTEIARGEVDLVLRAHYRDAAGLEGLAESAFRIDRKAPTLATESGKPEIRVSENSDGTTSIMVSGVASESLKRATVNGRDAGVQDRQFAVAGLDEAKSFTLVLEDLAGNRSEPQTFDSAFDFDRVAPQLEVSFGANDGGFAVAMLAPSEKLKSLTVNTHAAEPSADGSYVATLEHLLADLREPMWGPTHDPITIVAIDMSGNETKQVVVIAPIFGDKDPFGPIAIPVLGDAKHGRYCPRNASHHPLSEKRPEVHEDYFIQKTDAQCGRCGFKP